MKTSRKTTEVKTPRTMVKTVKIVNEQKIFTNLTKLRFGSITHIKNFSCQPGHHFFTIRRKTTFVIRLFGCSAIEDIKQWVSPEIITSEGKFRKVIDTYDKMLTGQ